MKKRIILFALSLILIIGMLSAGNAYAWFSSLQGGSQNVNYIKSGMISYTLGEGAFIVTDEDEVVYPEQNLLTGSVSLTNASTIPTKVRVKITYTYDGETLVCNPKASTGALSVTLVSPNDWMYDSTDGYVYYNNTVAAEADLALFSKICYSGPNTEDAKIKNTGVTVTVLYEARQSEYLNSWDFSTT